MKLNLGCGNDIRRGYTNVDFFLGKEAIDKWQHDRGVDLREVDLSKFPWPFEDKSANEILMLDFLEHFPYDQTHEILREAYRVLSPGGIIHVQVPDFAVCAIAAIDLENDLNHRLSYLESQCHVCGTVIKYREISCESCGTPRVNIRDAAIQRLYGGQDRPGNWHYNAFTKSSLKLDLEFSGFRQVFFLEKNENDETYSQNWNMRAVAKKI